MNILNEAGYQNVGELRFQMLTDPDAILGLSGVGPKAMQEIETVLDSLEIFKPAPEPVVEEVAAPEAVAEAPEAPEAEVAAPAEAEAVAPSQES